METLCKILVKYGTRIEQLSAGRWLRLAHERDVLERETKTHYETYLDAPSKGSWDLSGLMRSMKDELMDEFDITELPKNFKDRHPELIERINVCLLELSTIESQLLKIESWGDQFCYKLDKDRMHARILWCRVIIALLCFMMLGKIMVVMVWFLIDIICANWLPLYRPRLVFATAPQPSLEHFA